MSTEFSSGAALCIGDKIKGYEILQVFEAGMYTYPAKARAANGRTVFFKKYRTPGGSAKWFSRFIDYQTELKQRIESGPAKSLCYEFIEFFDLEKKGAAVPLRVIYQVFEWIEGGSDLRKMLNAANTNPSSLSWQQRVIFSRVMLAGINAIHKSGVIHTDLKPENLYLVPDAAVTAKYKLRVIDMDSSLLEGRPVPWPESRGYVQSPGYGSPEHLLGPAPAKASDVFTCGLMLGELLGKGHPAAPNLDDYEDIVKNGRLMPIEVQQPVEGVSDAAFLSFVINGCLRPEASRRPTAEQVLLALNGRLSEWDGRRASTTSTALPPPPPPPPPSPEPPAPPASGPPPAPAPPTTASSGVVLIGPGDHKRSANIETTFGRAVFKSWGADYEMFMSSEQFRLFKDGAGLWLVAHCPGAKNSTNVDGVPISTPVPLRTGMTVTLGKTGKCPVTLNLA